MGTRKIQEAIEAYPRERFLPVSGRDRAGVNAPIGIGYGQTNSQPTTVMQMLEWLNVKRGAHVLDVGSGSGWTTALLSYLVGEKGDVVAVELVPNLVEFGRRNCEDAGVDNAAFYHAKEVYGWPEQAPYDNILVSASAHELPDDLIEQLKAPGTLVIPIQNAIYLIEKDTDGALTTHVHPGYVFVPLLPGH